MRTESKQSKRFSRDALCTCKACKHDIARDCLKLKCVCCNDDNHSMVMDGMIGFGSIRKK